MIEWITTRHWQFEIIFVNANASAMTTRRSCYDLKTVCAFNDVLEHFHVRHQSHTHLIETLNWKWSMKNTWRNKSKGGTANKVKWLLFMCIPWCFCCRVPIRQNVYKFHFTKNPNLFEFYVCIFLVFIKQNQPSIASENFNQPKWKRRT